MNLDSLNVIITGAYIVIGILALVICFIVYRFVFKRTEKLDTEDRNDKPVKYVDSSEAIPIDDIRDGMIIDDNGSRFTAVLICKGADFYTDSEKGRLGKQVGYIGFLKQLTSPVTYRQYSEEINIDTHMERYQKAYDDLQKLYFNLSEDYQNARARAERLNLSGSPEDRYIAELLEKAPERLRAYEWRLNHLQSQIDYMNINSGPWSDIRKTVETYVFSWSDPGGIMSSNNRGEELIREANEELQRTADAMIRQLEEAGVTARRATTGELIDMVRRHTLPYSGNEFTMEDINASTYYDSVVDTDSYRKQIDAAADEMLSDLMLS